MISLSVNGRVNNKVLVAAQCVALILIYPFSMKFFIYNVSSYTASGGALSLLGSIIGFAAIFFPSLYGLSQLNRGDAAAPAEVSNRIMLHLLVCTPVLFTFLTLIGFITGVHKYSLVLWFSLTLLASFFIVRINSTQAKAYPAWMRVGHGILAALFIIGFLALHWVNHLAAIWSRSRHGILQDTLRIWYRANWFEPILLLMCTLLILSGFYMAIQHVKRGGDRFKRLQTASGSYMGIFLCTHLTAVFYSRNSGIDTNWAFATGENGLLFSFQFLIPYYALALVYFSLHCGLALRQILIAHQQPERRVSWVYQSTKILGLLLSVLVMIAALGYSINP